MSLTGLAIVVVLVLAMGTVAWLSGDDDAWGDES